jgi:uncharacterized protein involved in outer membrane biogenesis
MKRYIKNVTALVILTAAAVLLFLARVKPNTVRDETKRQSVIGG